MGAHRENRRRRIIDCWTFGIIAALIVVTMILNIVVLVEHL